VGPGSESLAGVRTQTSSKRPFAEFVLCALRLLFRVRRRSWAGGWPAQPEIDPFDTRKLDPDATHGPAQQRSVVQRGAGTLCAPLLCALLPSSLCASLCACAPCVPVWCVVLWPRLCGGNGRAAAAYLRFLQTSSNRRLLQVQLAASKQALLHVAASINRMRGVTECPVVPSPRPAGACLCSKPLPAAQSRGEGDAGR
jgi:hypothetical protein